MGNVNVQKASWIYPFIIGMGLLGNIASLLSNWQTIVSALGLFISTLLLGVGILGVFVSQKRISTKDGILYSLIWTMFIALAGTGYYVLITRPLTIHGVVLDNDITRNPVPNIEISLYEVATGNTRSVRTSNNGEFTFQEVRDGGFDIQVTNVVVYSGQVPSGLQKLVVGTIDIGRFYLGTIQASTPSNGATNPTAEVLISETSTATSTLDPTASPSELPIPTQTLMLASSTTPTQSPIATTFSTITFTPSLTSTQSVTYLPTETSTHTAISPILSTTAHSTTLGRAPVSSECRIHAPRQSAARQYRDPDVDSPALGVVGDYAIMVTALYNDESGNQWWIYQMPNTEREVYIRVEDVAVSRACVQYMLEPPIPVASPNLIIELEGEGLLLRPIPSMESTPVDIVYQDYVLHVLAKCHNWYLVERPWSPDSPAWVLGLEDLIDLDPPDAQIPEDCSYSLQN